MSFTRLRLLFLILPTYLPSGLRVTRRKNYTICLINVRSARTYRNTSLISRRFAGSRGRHSGFDVDEEIHYPTRPVDKEKAEHELVVNIKKATSPEESAPKQKHVRSELITECTCSWYLDLNRVHRLHLGLPLVYILLGWSSSSTDSC